MFLAFSTYGCTIQTSISFDLINTTNQNIRFCQIVKSRQTTTKLSINFRLYDSSLCISNVSQRVPPIMLHGVMFTFFLRWANRRWLLKTCVSNFYASSQLQRIILLSWGIQKNRFTGKNAVYVYFVSAYHPSHQC